MSSIGSAAPWANTLFKPYHSAYIQLGCVISTAGRLWRCLCNALISTALIVHEGPSVFRIFHRWQAVNQQWKVLNYDKTMDSDDLKAAAVDRTQPTQGYQTGVGLSASTSSLMVVASTAAGSTSTAVVTTAGGLGAQPVDPTTANSSSSTAVPDQHCPYNILHLLSHLRQPEARGQPSNSSRELVMRVTTVWRGSRSLTSDGGEGFMNGWTDGVNLKVTGLDYYNFSCLFKMHLCCPYVDWIKVQLWFTAMVGKLLFLKILISAKCLKRLGWWADQFKCQFANDKKLLTASLVSGPLSVLHYPSYIINGYQDPCKAGSTSHTHSVIFTWHLKMWNLNSPLTWPTPFPHNALPYPKGA